MNDDHDIEATLRHHLRHRAESIGAETPLGGTLAVREAVRGRTAARHRRRMAAASVATVAAVGTGLVLIAREPADQDVRTKQNQSAAASSGLAAGSSTGSSTGSATGSPTGWTRVATTDPAGLARLAASVPAGFILTNRYEETVSRNGGERAADIAVAAQIEIGGNIQFVIASVQDSTRLASGKGGTEVTIAGRPGRIISKRGATTLTWDVSDTSRALVVSTGVDDAVLAEWLASLQVGADGQWAFTANGVGGLNTVATVTPSEQSARSLMWELPADPASDSCTSAGMSFDAISGGAYEFWAEMADRMRWEHDLPRASTVHFPPAADGVSPEVLAFLFDDGASLLTTDGTTVVRTTAWAWTESGESVSAGAANVEITAPDDATWAALTPSAISPSAACLAGKERVEQPAPPATAPPSIIIDPATPTTAPATTAPPTTVAGA